MQSHKIIILAKIAQFSITALSIKILTSILSFSDLAQYGVSMSIASVLTMTIGSPISTYMMRKSHTWKNDGVIIDALLLYLKLLFIFCFIVILIFYIFLKFDVVASNSVLKIAITGILYFFSSALNWSVIGLFNTLGYQKKYSILMNFTLLLSLLFSVFLCKFIGHSFQWWICGGIIGQIFVVCISLPEIKNTFETKNTPMLKQSQMHFSISEIVHFVAPLSLSAILGSILLNWYKWLPSNYIELSDVGVVVGCFMFSTGLMNALEQTAASIFQPNFYKQIYSGSLDERRFAWFKYAERMSSTLIIGFSAYIASLKYLSALLLSNKFQNTIFILVICGLADFMRVMNNVLSIMYDAEMKTIKLVIPAFLAICILALIISTFKLKYAMSLIPIISVLTYFVLIICNAIQVNNNNNMMVDLLKSKMLVKTLLLSLVAVMTVSSIDLMQFKYIVSAIISIGLTACIFGSIWLMIVRPL